MGVRTGRGIAAGGRIGVHTQHLGGAVVQIEQESKTPRETPAGIG
jgi:hypothetical protein